ncbi:MAG: hypothetical protein NXI25_05060 [bacterium]|nr:hypothetical protein [bacterium]
MERREFIIKSGVVITAAALLSAGHPAIAQTLSGAEKPGEKRNKKRPDPHRFSQPIMKAIAIGLNAPSPHNTQSWKFKIIDDNSMLFYVDREVLLPATDPPSRQIHIGAGCFIETLAIGITPLGLTADIQYFPEGYEEADDFGIKPVAEIQVRQADNVAVHPLAPYILDRQTNRRPSTGEIVKRTTFEDLQAMAGEVHSKVLFFNENLNTFKDIFYRGLDIESRTRSTNEETRLLFRFSESERAEKGNGLSIPQMGYKGLMAKIVEMSVRKGDPVAWHKSSTIDKSMKHIKKAIESTKGVVIWITETNTFKDWVENGRDYMRFSLACTARGLYLHPYNQAIQEYAEMDDLRAEFDQLIGVSGTQKIQMVVRIGHSSKPYYTYRKSLEDYLM